MRVNIRISTKKPNRPKPETPSVSLTLEAYDALMELSIQHNVSMRKLASEIIMQAVADLKVEVDDE